MVAPDLVPGLSWAEGSPFVLRRECPMSKFTGLVGALGAFGALAYLLAPLPPDAPSANVVAKVATSDKPAALAPAAASDVAASLARPEPATDATVRLVQQIQTELLRLGCYDGVVDGRWSQETQQAMHTLGERLRVLRPVETPDYIMLALARGQASHACVGQARETVSRQPARIVPMAAPWQSEAERTLTTSRRQSNRAATAAAPAARPRPLAFSEGRTAPAEARPEDAIGRTAGDAAAAMSLMDREALEQSRMGLGVATVDPLLAPPTPLVSRAADAGHHPAVEAVPPLAQRPRTAPETTSVARPDWKRDFFRKLSENGP